MAIEKHKRKRHGHKPYISSFSPFILYCLIVSGVHEILVTFLPIPEKKPTTEID